MSITIHTHDGVHYVYPEDLTLDWADFRYDNYRHGETTVLQPQLEALGFTVHGWYSAEADSFGVLVRAANATYHDIRVKFVYG
jgi:hypothetical protein